MTVDIIMGRREATGGVHGGQMMGSAQTTDAIPELGALHEIIMTCALASNK